VQTTEEGRDREGAKDRTDDVPPAIEEIVRAGTRLALGSAGLAVASAADGSGRQTGAETGGEPRRRLGGARLGL
jgi:hypothetical protein